MSLLFDGLESNEHLFHNRLISDFILKYFRYSKYFHELFIETEIEFTESSRIRISLDLKFFLNIFIHDHADHTQNEDRIKKLCMTIRQSDLQSNIRI